MEPQNANAYRRYIYIHGTPEERNIGHPVSYGCVRMRSRDVIQLYATVGLGAEVTIVNTDLHSINPEILPPGGVAEKMKEPFAGVIARYGSLPNRSCIVRRDSISRSASTMICTSSLNRTFGSQPRIFFAFAGSPMSISTSAGRS